VLARRLETLGIEHRGPLKHDGGNRSLIGLQPPGRTFASILAEVGVAPRRAMYLLGHTDPRFTMRVYEQVFDAEPQTVAQLETVLGCHSRRRSRSIRGGRFPD
jgi:hypothetical protein